MSASASERDQLRRITDLLGGERMLRRPLESLVDAHALLLEGLPWGSVSHLIGNLEFLRGNESLARAIGMSARVSKPRHERLSPAQSCRIWVLAEVLVPGITIR